MHPVEGDGEDLVGVVRSPCLRQILQQTGLLRDCVVDGKFSHKEGGEGRQKRLSGRIRQIGSHILVFSLGGQGLLRSTTLSPVTVEMTAVVLGCVINVVNNIPQVLPFFLAALVDGVPVVAPDDHAEIAVEVADDFGLFLGKRKPDDIRRIGHDIHRDFRGAGGSFRHDYTDSLDACIVSWKYVCVKKRCLLAEDILKDFPGDSVFLYPNLGNRKSSDVRIQKIGRIHEASLNRRPCAREAQFETKSLVRTLPSW